MLDFVSRETASGKLTSSFTLAIVDLRSTCLIIRKCSSKISEKMGCFVIGTNPIALQ